jgi:hypothetical protein
LGSRIERVLNIKFDVIARQAQAQLAMVQRQVGSLDKQAIATQRATSLIGTGGALTGLRKWGSQVQWAGRQLQYNFTLPILLAGGAATKFALDNEKALVRVQKVYGDASMSPLARCERRLPLSRRPSVS